MTILVTGAIGLVGARLPPRLVEADRDCRALVQVGKKVPGGVTAVKAIYGMPRRSLARSRASRRSSTWRPCSARPTMI